MSHFHGRTWQLTVLAGVSLMMLLAGSVGGAAAEGGCDGTISGQALRPLPANAGFDVDVYDNSDANHDLRERLLAALRQAGRPVATGGPLMISVISESLFPHYRPDTRAVGTPTTQATTDQLGVNRTRTTIENLQPAPKNQPIGPNRRYEQQIDVRFEVRDATTRQFIWLGTMSCSPLSENRSQVVDAVIAAFIATVGQTVTDAPL